MPKLDEAQAASRMRRVEDAALALFKERGYHGAGLREIAARARVSLGNIYNYYASKEAVFESIIARLYAEFAAEDSPLAAFFRENRFPDDLEEFGRAVGEMVERHVDYLTLVYVDVAEFGGRHVRPHYEDLAGRFETLLGERFEELRVGRGDSEGVDPAVAFAAVYMQFSNYFIVERMIGARGHLGLSDEEAVRAITLLFRKGLEGMYGVSSREVSPRHRDDPVSAEEARRKEGCLEGQDAAGHDKTRKSEEDS